MGAISKALAVLGLFPWTVLTFLLRPVVPAVAGKFLVGAGAVFLVMSATTTTRAWWKRRSG